MADYSVDVKVKLDVQEIQNAVNAKPITATIVPKITFNNNIDGNKDLKPVKDAVQRYFQEDSNRVGLRFKEDEKFLQRDLEKIQSQINKVTSINIKTQLDDNFKQFKDDLLSIQYLTKDLKSKTVRISFDTPSDSKLGEIESRIESYFETNPIKLSFSSSDLESIKTYIEEYFVNNPINLNLSGTTTGTNIVEETKDALDEEKNISIEHYKELKLEHQKYLMEKRDSQYQNIEESKQKQKELSEEIKSYFHEEIASQKQAFDEKHNNLLEYAEQTKNVSQQLSQEIEQAEKDALNELQNALNANNVTEVFKQETEQLIHLYKQGTIDFATFSDDMLEKMKKAQEDGLVPDDVVQKIKKKYDEMSLAHQQSLEKQQQQAENIRQKEIKDFEVQKEKEQEANKKAIEDELKDTQDLYNKKLISAEEYVERMRNILPQAFEAGVNGAQKFQNSLDVVEKELEEANSFTHAFNETIQSFNTSSNSMFNSLMRYFGVTKIFDAVQGSFSKMITEVKNLDVELTEFSKVTDLTAQETEQFIDDSYRLGETVAKTGTEVVTATTLFKKMGYTVDESMDFAKDALMWTNVADGMVSVEDAANMLISTMKAYGEEAVSATQIIDALNEVSNNYSTSSSALSNNLSTVAATLATSGTDLYQTIGLMTAGIEVMPDKASKVANGLKTISQRIRQIDGDTADKLDDFLGSKGISRYDELTGQLKGTYDILEEISKLWNDLSVNERQYIGEVMAGKNQITVLNAVMTNFATAINATETAMNSAGSAAEENKRVLESIQGHIQAFKSAFSELSRDIIDSGLFKDIVDFGTSIIKWLDNLIKNYKPEIIDALGAIGAAIVGMQLTNAVTHVVQLVQAFGALGPAGLGAAAGIGVVAATVVDFLQRTREANTQFQSLVELGSKGLPTNAPELEKSIKRYEELYELLQKETDKEKIHQYAEELGQIRTTLKYIGIDVDLISGNYENQLSKLKEILSTQREIELNNKKQAFQESSSEDIVKNTIQNNEQAFGLNNAYLFNTPDAYAKRLQEAVDTIYNLNIGGETLKAILDDNERSIQEKQTALESAYKEYQEKAIWLHTQASTASDEETRAFYEGQEEQIQAYAGVIYQLIESLKEQSEKYGEVVDAASVVVKDKLEKWGFDLSKLTEEQLASLKEAIESEDVWAIDIPLDELGLSLEQLKSILNDPELKEGFLKLIGDEELRQKVEALAGATEDAVDTVATSLSGAIAMLGDYASQAEILAQAQDDITNSGQITAETLKKIADAGLEAYLVYDEETKSLVVNTQAFFDNNAAQEDAAIAAYVAGEQAKLEADIQNILSGNLGTTTTALGTQDTALENNATAHKDAATAAAEYGAELEKNLILEGKYTDAQIAAVKARVDSYKQEVQAGIAAIQSFYSGVTDPRTATSRGASHSGGSGSSSSRSSTSTADREAEKAQREAEQAAKDAQKAWKDAFEVEYKKLKTYLDSELITYEEYYDALEILNEQFFAGRAEFEEEYWKYKDEAIKGYKKYIEDELKDYFKKGETSLKRSLEKEEITQEQYFDYLEELYKAYYTDKDEYEEAMAELSHERFMYEKKQREQEIKDLQDQISDLFKHGETLLEHQLAMDEITEEQYYDALTLLYEAYYDDKEKYEEEYWKLQEKIYAYQKKKRQEELDDLENQLEELYNEAERLHKEYIESLEEENDALETTISYAIDVLDEEIDKLKAEKSALDEANEALSEQIKLQELEDNLEKAKQKKVRVYRKGQGFVYEQDTKAISEAQTALDEYKKELQHKKQLSMIDEEISKLEEYKKEWKSITESYKNAQDEMTAKGILGENARERILAREHSAVELVGKKYENVKDRIKAANDATIDNMEAYIGDENTANTLSYEIKKIKDKIDEVKSKTVTVGVQANSNIGTIINDIKGKMDEVKNKTATISVTDNASSTITNIIGAINTLKGKLEQSYSTQNMTDWLTKWKTTIYQAYLYSQEYGITPSTGGGSGSGSGGSGSGGSGSDISVGTRIPETDEIIAGIVADNDVTENLVRQYMNAKDYEVKGTDYDTGKLQIGPVGESGVTWLLSQSYLSSGSGSSGSGDSGSSGGGEYTEPVYGSNGAIIGYNHYSGDGTLLYYEAAHAQGTLGTTTKTFLVNEKGMEAMVTPEGTVISAPTTGYGVIKNEYTERLTDFAADPMSFLNKTFSGYSGTYKNNNSSNETININGNLTLPNVTDGQSFIDSIRNVALQYTTRRK